MRTILVRLVVGAAVWLLVSAHASAQNAQEIKVQAKRAMNTKVVGRTSSGVPIVNVSLSYGVSVADLDLTSSSGAAEVARRVNDAAQAACKEIGRQYPDATPSERECTKSSADEAMVKVRELVAAAKKAAGK